MQLLNPGHAAIAKLRDLYRQVIYIEHRDADRLEELKTWSRYWRHPLFAGVQIQFEIPWEFTEPLRKCPGMV